MDTTTDVCPLFGRTVERSNRGSRHSQMHRHADTNADRDGYRGTQEQCFLFAFEAVFKQLSFAFNFMSSSNDFKSVVSEASCLCSSNIDLLEASEYCAFYLISSSNEFSSNSKFWCAVFSVWRVQSSRSGEPLRALPRPSTSRPPTSRQCL